MWVSLNCSDTDFSNIIPKLRLRPVRKLERPHWHASLRSWLLLSFNKSLRNFFQKLKMFQYFRLNVYCFPFQKKTKRHVILVLLNFLYVFLAQIIYVFLEFLLLPVTPHSYTRYFHSKPRRKESGPEIPSAALIHFWPKIGFLCSFHLARTIQ